MIDEFGISPKGIERQGEWLDLLYAIMKWKKDSRKLEDFIIASEGWLSEKRLPLLFSVFCPAAENFLYNEEKRKELGGK